MSRIIAGTLRGRTLAIPRKGTRPTSDRVREALFSALEAQQAIEGAHVLDLYAGSGALGLEALSRGAAHLTAVEAALPAVQILKDNARSLGVAPQVVQAKVSTFLARGIGTLRGAPFHLVFLDPPYELEIDADVAALAAGDWLAEDAIIVAERSAKSAPPTFPDRFTHVREKKYGDTSLWFATL